jgi:hypothetical protein
MEKPREPLSLRDLFEMVNFVKSLEELMSLLELIYAKLFETGPELDPVIVQNYKQRLSQTLLSLGISIEEFQLLLWKLVNIADSDFIKSEYDLDISPLTKFLKNMNIESFEDFTDKFWRETIGLN